MNGLGTLRRAGAVSPPSPVATRSSAQRHPTSQASFRFPVRHSCSARHARRGGRMTSQRLAVTLTALNLVLLLGVMAQDRVAQAKPPLGVLRGRALELVDDQGRVRAEIKILPADQTVTMPDGTLGYA